MTETTLTTCDWCGRERLFPPDFACSRDDSAIWSFHKALPSTEDLCKAMIEARTQLKPAPARDLGEVYTLPLLRARAPFPPPTQDD